MPGRQPVVAIREKNYFFRMSKYQQARSTTSRPTRDFIAPEKRANEVLGFLRQPLGDLCISRPKARLNWGIALPFDDHYVSYVWFDALLNYLTGPATPTARISRNTGQRPNMSLPKTFSNPMPSTGRPCSGRWNSLPMSASMSTGIGTWTPPRCPSRSATWCGQKIWSMHTGWIRSAILSCEK